MLKKPLEESRTIHRPTQTNLHLTIILYFYLHIEVAKQGALLFT